MRERLEQFRKAGTCECHTCSLEFDCQSMMSNRGVGGVGGWVRL